MSDRSTLNQQRLPTRAAAAAKPTEVVVTSTVSAASVAGETDEVVSLVRDADLIEAVGELSRKFDELLYLIRALAE